MIGKRLCKRQVARIIGCKESELVKFTQDIEPVGYEGYMLWTMHDVSIDNYQLHQLKEQTGLSPTVISLHNREHYTEMAVTFSRELRQN